MKTYKQFKDFVSQDKYCGTRWCFIRQDAIKEGFNRHLLDFYKFLFLQRYKKQTLKNIIKKILKCIFYIVAYVGLVAITLNMCALVKSATIRNETETLALVVDTCRKAPKLCEYTVITGKLKLIEKQKD